MKHGIFSITWKRKSRTYWKTPNTSRQRGHKEKSEKKTMVICDLDINGVAPAEFCLQYQEIKHDRKQKLGEFQGFNMMEKK